MFNPILYLPLLGALLARSCLCANPTIDQQLYSTFVKFTKYAAAAYASDCPQPPNNSTVVAYLDNAATSTQATVFRNDIDKEVVVAFRGTSDLIDFLTDSNQALVPFAATGINCDACMVNNGTLVSWNSITDQVTTTLQSQESYLASYQLVITGHSLGGALASMASASLIGLGYNLTTYTLGQFRTGDPNYANYLDSLLPPNSGKLFRLTHTNDGIPQTLTTAMGYRHHSTEFWELEPFGPNETQQCQGQDPPDCNNSQPGYGIGNGGKGINAAHLCYTGILIGNPIDAGASSCNAVSLLPQACSTATGGGITKREEQDNEVR